MKRVEVTFCELTVRVSVCFVCFENLLTFIGRSNANVFLELWLTITRRFVCALWHRPSSKAFRPNCRNSLVAKVDSLPSFQTDMPMTHQKLAPLFFCVPLETAGGRLSEKFKVLKTVYWSNEKAKWLNAWPFCMWIHLSISPMLYGICGIKNKIRMVEYVELWNYASRSDM